jgi:hypothetical protein
MVRASSRETPASFDSLLKLGVTGHIRSICPSALLPLQLIEQLPAELDSAVADALGEMHQPVQVGAGDFALAPRHRRRVAISFVAGILNCSAAFSTASRSSVASTSPTHIAFLAARWMVHLTGCGGSCGLRATSVFLGRQLRQQVRPVARDNAADFRVDLRDIVETLLDLLADQLKFFRAERTSVQEFY